MDSVSARRIGIWLAAALPFCAFAAPARADDPGAEAFAVFQRRCVECHGPSKQNGKLRLDTLDAVFKGGKSGPPIAAGRSAESLLFERLSEENPKRRMPPKGDPLDEKEIQAIRQWIDSGAKAPAAVSAGSGGAPREVVKPDAAGLPASYAPVYCIAGDPAAKRLAVGRGAAVAVYELIEEDASKAKEKGAKPAGPSLKRAAVIRGHDDIVRAVAFSPDSTLLASGDFGTARVWDTKTWELRRSLAPHADLVLALAFSPDSKRLAAGGGLPTESGEVKAWDVETGALAWSAAPHSDAVYGLAWPRTGGVVVTGGADRVTYLLDSETGRQVRRLEAHTHHVLAVALSADGKLAATAGSDRRIKLWDLEKGENVRTARGHDKAATWVGIYGDGKKLVSTGADGQLRFWSFDNENERASLGEAKGCLQGGCLLDGEKLIATAEEAGTVRVYDTEKRKLLAAAEVDAR